MVKYVLSQRNSLNCKQVVMGNVRNLVHTASRLERFAVSMTPQTMVPTHGSECLSSYTEPLTVTYLFLDMRILSMTVWHESKTLFSDSCQCITYGPKRTTCPAKSRVLFAIQIGESISLLIFRTGYCLPLAVQRPRPPSALPLLLPPK